MSAPADSAAAPKVEETQAKMDASTTAEVPTVKLEGGEAAMEVVKTASASHPPARDPASIPLKKLSVNLIKTYKHINEVFGRSHIAFSSQIFSLGL